MKNYTVIARRSPNHSAIRIQFNDAPAVGEQIMYRGMWLIVIAVMRNRTS